MNDCFLGFYFEKMNVTMKGEKKTSAASHPLGQPFKLLGGFIEEGSRLWRFQKVEVSFRNAPHHSARSVL